MNRAARGARSLPSSGARAAAGTGTTGTNAVYVFNAVNGTTAPVIDMIFTSGAANGLTGSLTFTKFEQYN
jgi:hypothetical protein